MFAKHLGRTLIPRLSAARELEELGLDLFDVVEVLENGFDCSSGGNRKTGIEEKCLRKGNKTLRMVAAEGLFVLPGERTEQVWYVIHVSQETTKERRLK